jgi:ribonuclease P protein component
MDFPKEARVRSRAEYLRFFEGSTVKRLRQCTIFRVSGTAGIARVGITIKAKVNSVYRNKLKRQIREAFRHERGGLGSWDYNVVIPGSVKVDHGVPRRIREELRRAWKNDVIV